MGIGLATEGWWHAHNRGGLGRQASVHGMEDSGHLSTCSYFMLEFVA